MTEPHMVNSPRQRCGDNLRRVSTRSYRKSCGKGDSLRGNGRL